MYFMYIETRTQCNGMFGNRMFSNRLFGNRMFSNRMFPLSRSLKNESQKKVEINTLFKENIACSP